MQKFDLTPDPQVLIALTHTPLKPLDALCELIDNSIDAFQIARLQGDEVEFPVVMVDIPMPSELKNNGGVLRIRDNALGLDFESAEKALKAGFSGNNPYDSLGLFGMGFNIATGKLGRVTKFTTAQKRANGAIQAEIDLEKMAQEKSYAVPVDQIDSPSNLEHGTVVEVREWWPDGTANYGFIRKLVGYGKPEVRRQLGRRYATILREGKVRILVNGEECEPFEHCYWGENRSVEHREYGRIPAYIPIDRVLGTQKRCMDCTALVPSTEMECASCGSASTRTIDERVRGWVGIQRFDDQTLFGIDLIRNGRAIRIGEKAAFFEFTDEFGEPTKDYPIDSQYGRIIGEIHLDHVPVDFLKQDFQRTSPEWQGAISHVRGDSSLQPTQPGASENESPIFRLYQGYRRVRQFGKKHMYMGYWDKDKGKPARISRDTEQQYYEKFKKKIPGFYDDNEWWVLSRS